MKVYFDLETRSLADLRKQGSKVYAEHPSTEVLCLAWAVDDAKPKIWTFESGEEPKEFLSLIRPGVTFIAHNAAFERNVLAHKPWPKIPLSQLRCTMALAHYLSLPASLENVARACGLKMQKDKIGQNVMLALCKPNIRMGRFLEPWDEQKGAKLSPRQKFDHLYRYCMDDVEVCREIWRSLPKLPESEQRLWELDRVINERGVPVDLPAAKTAIDLIDRERKRLDQEMRRVSGNQVAGVSDVKGLTRLVADYGYGAEIDKQAVVDLLDNPDLPKDLRLALLIRQEGAKSSTAKLKAMILGADSRDRVCDTLQYHAASTGRWGGRRIQPQNFPRPDLSQDEIEELLGWLA